MISPVLIKLIYLFSASLFIVGIKYLGSPATARKGNLLSSLGMLIAIIITLLDRSILSYQVIVIGMIIGSILGGASARLVKMTAMPQMVGLQNGFGGGASTLVAFAEVWNITHSGQSISQETLASILFALLVGGVTFTGSILAFGKLQEWVRGTPITFRFQQWVNGFLVISFLVGSVWVFKNSDSALGIFSGLALISLLLGFLFVMPIGGADMPVVISLLNSFSGVAAAATGFIISNNILIVAGALVGASGLILTQIMCKAMNRPLTNVLFGAFGGVSVGKSTEALQPHQTIRTVDVEQAAMMLGYAKSLIIVPGYGMAAAQAQHAVQSLSSTLEKRGVNVKYAIHPVAGRMPGHMNVLLAEANVPYEQLYAMEDINPEFERTDVVLVIGANDVVNPAAKENPKSPIYGMPILEVDKARSVIVIKRSMNPGFAGIENDLFYKERTSMLFGNAKEVVSKLVNEIQSL